MRRTRMALAATTVALSTLAAGTGIALAQSEPEPDPELAEQCGSYNFIEWLLFHHECHGHAPPYIVYWPSFG
jgi:hypothetical protein